MVLGNSVSLGVQTGYICPIKKSQCWTEFVAGFPPVSVTSILLPSSILVGFPPTRVSFTHFPNPNCLFLSLRYAAESLCLWKLITIWEIRILRLLIVMSSSSCFLNVEGNLQGLFQQLKCPLKNVPTPQIAAFLKFWLYGLSVITWGELLRISYKLHLGIKNNWFT